MKKVIGIVVVVVLVAAGVWFVANYFEVDTAGEFEAPSVDVDVDADAGNIPEVEVRAPDIEIGTEEVEVSVPDVDVSVEEKTVEVPSIAVEKPGEEEDVVPE